MIELTTNCESCVHEKVCKNRNGAKYAMEKLKSMTYGNGPNDDYNWDVMMAHHNIHIKFSCDDFQVRYNSVR